MTRGFNSRKCIVSGCEEEIVHPFLIIKSGYCLKHLKNKGKVKKKLKEIKNDLPDLWKYEYRKN